MEMIKIYAFTGRGKPVRVKNLFDKWSYWIDITKNLLLFIFPLPIFSIIPPRVTRWLLYGQNCCRSLVYRGYILVPRSRLKSGGWTEAPACRGQNPGGTPEAQQQSTSEKQRSSASHESMSECSQWESSEFFWVGDDWLLRRRFSELSNGPTIPCVSGYE